MSLLIFPLYVFPSVSKMSAGKTTEKETTTAIETTRESSGINSGAKRKIGGGRKNASRKRKCSGGKRTT